MTALCKYARPQLWDAAGLEKDLNAVMFPYHPQMYETASDIYGRGGLLAWFLLIGSVSLTSAWWPVEEINQKSWRKPRITGDLLGVVVPAMYASTDAVSHAMGMRDLQDRAEVLGCLHFPNLMRNWTEEIPDGSLGPIGDIPDDLVAYGQKIIALSGPFSVSYMYLATVIIWWSIWDHESGRDRHDNKSITWKPERGVVRIVFGSATYVAVCLIIVQISFLDFWMSYLLTFIELVWPLWFLFTSVLACVALFFIGCIFAYIGSNIVWCIGRAGWLQRVYGEKPNIGFLLYLIIGCGTLIYLCGGMAYLIIKAGSITLFTDLKTSLSDSGQLSPLLGGVIITSYTLYDVLIFEKRRRRKKQARLDVSEGLHLLAAEINA